ncbi:STAS domain-containing protein [Jeotgalibacillus proteolyticus]|uniref:RsbR protein n=1 Tax=Jeotgalibacillus proteolyticus TaxID=2082395 RepID=A0A2S5GC24_9BACL|nr:STAS domain-containing protein [Jeotgalibacillus proteolyticus]PPA70546.1 RsbR protein [Jeotgalibacillus proteolyticus]
MYNEIISHIKNRKTEIIEEWIDRVKEAADERMISVVSEQVFQGTSYEFVDLILLNLDENNSEYKSKLEMFSEKIVRLGWPITFVVSGLRTFTHVVHDDLIQEKKISKDREGEYLEFLDNWLAPLSNEIIHTYASTWEKTVSLQKIALQELSAPLIPVVEHISIMPLVGTIDTERAKLIMENLLEGVVSHRAEVVLIDITGVPVVDTMVAHHVIQAAEAVHLVGARCMLVGIRPEIAQTIVNLGIDLNKFITTSTLRKGMEKALEMTNRKIVELEEVN